MTTIVCYDPHGQPVPVAANTLTFRPASYGIFTENNEILLLQNVESGWLTWPGKVLQEGERPYPAISRVYHLLTGIIPLVGKLVAMEDLYQVDNDGRAWHISAMFYWLERPSATSLSLTATDDNFQPRMIPAVSIRRSQLQFGYQALQIALRRLQIA